MGGGEKNKAPLASNYNKGLNTYAIGVPDRGRKEWRRKTFEKIITKSL